MKTPIALSRCSTSGPTSPLWSWIDRQTTSNQLLGSQLGVLAIMLAPDQLQPATGSESAEVPLRRRGVVVGGGLGDLALALDGFCLDLLGLNGNTHLRDLEDEFIRIDTGCEHDPLRKWHLAEADALVDLDKPRDVDVEERWDVARHALHLDRRDDLLEDAELELAGGGRLADRDERDLHRQLLPKVDREEIDVHQLGGPRVDLQLADQYLAGASAVEREVDQVAVAGVVPDPLQAARFDRERLRLDVVSVENRRHLATTSDGMDVAPGFRPDGRAEFEGGCHLCPATLPAPASPPS